jgi:hypothetical protein
MPGFLEWWIDFFNECKRRNDAAAEAAWREGRS